MIDNVYELILGIYLAIIIFFLGYYGIGESRDSFMKNTSLNWIFITFFIIMFFLFGYLFQNLLLSFKDVKKREYNAFINTSSEIGKTETVKK